MVGSNWNPTWRRWLQRETLTLSLGCVAVWWSKPSALRNNWNLQISQAFPSSDYNLGVAAKLRRKQSRLWCQLDFCRALPNREISTLYLLFAQLTCRYLTSNFVHLIFWLPAPFAQREEGPFVCGAKVWQNNLSLFSTSPFWLLLPALHMLRGLALY